MNLTLKAFPNIFAWTSYGLQVAIEGLWQQSRVVREQPWTDPSHSYAAIEFMSYLERLLLFNQSGSLSCLPYRAFKALGMYEGITKSGWPCFPRSKVTITTLAPYFLNMEKVHVPQDKKRDEIILSATASIKNHYGVETAQVLQFTGFDAGLTTY
jgi:hypothetical protein